MQIGSPKRGFHELPWRKVVHFQSGKAGGNVQLCAFFALEHNFGKRLVGSMSWLLSGLPMSRCFFFLIAQAVTGVRRFVCFPDSGPHVLMRRYAKHLQVLPNGSLNML